MNKKRSYSVQNAINIISAKLNLNLKDAYTMSGSEFSDANKKIREYVEFVKHPDYIQFVPKIKDTGELILL